MKKQRVYVDTSVIGGSFEREFATWSNGLMQDFALGIFTPVTSEIVASEIAEAPPFIQDKFVQLLSYHPEVLPISNASLALSHLYQERQILTPKYFNDGVHIALATVAEVDVLVSWNFRHIVNFNKIRLFNAVNIEQGYKPVQIFSPREVTTYGNE